MKNSRNKKNTEIRKIKEGWGHDEGERLENWKTPCGWLVGGF